MYLFRYWGSKSTLEPNAKLVSPFLIEVGDKVYICEHSWLNAKDFGGKGESTLKIGNGTYIGRFVQINAWKEVVIEENVLISDRVFISDADHNFSNINEPIIQQEDYYKGAIKLKTGCWLGIGVVKLPGVTIGKNSVVAANSVVTKSVPDYSVVAGSPAKIIRILSNL